MLRVWRDEGSGVTKEKQTRPDRESGRAALTDAGVDGGARADHNRIRFGEAILRWDLEIVSSCPCAALPSACSGAALSSAHPVGRRRRQTGSKDLDGRKHGIFPRRCGEKRTQAVQGGGETDILRLCLPVLPMHKSLTSARARPSPATLMT